MPNILCISTKSALLWWAELCSVRFNSHCRGHPLQPRRGADTGGRARWSLHSSCVLATSCILPSILPQSSAWSEFASSCSEGGCFLPQAVGKQEPQPFLVVSATLTCCSVLEKEVQMHSPPVIWLRIDSAFIKSMKVWNTYYIPNTVIGNWGIQQWRGQVRPLFSWSLDYCGRQIKQ